MKKKLIAMLMVAAMVGVMLTGCGSSEAPAEEAAATEEVTEDAAADGEMVSDETFAALQENYASVTEAYDAVAELYSSDEIAADADIEATMTQAADVIAQMGEITQDSITEADAEELNSAMMDILDALSMLVDGMEAADTTEAADGEMVSDETFATLQENYSSVTEAYDAVAELYNSDEIEANADIEDLITQAADVLTQMGEITQDTLTEADAETLNGALMDILTGLQGIIDAM